MEEAEKREEKRKNEGGVEEKRKSQLRSGEDGRKEEK